MFTKSLVILLVISLFFGLLNYAGAHEDEHQDWEPISAGPITTWTASLCGKRD
ncbi:MAG: hypothetical protein NC898_06670 [Candidatus Omnitrophica bacterium]|nr:hypothetical protein [Candidatus Omnitrophota bacterium]MCM8794116.1 hypothetical protein [Candidatus Omnitrophota bacterium]